MVFDHPALTGRATAVFSFEKGGEKGRWVNCPRVDSLETQVQSFGPTKAMFFLNGTPENKPQVFPKGGSQG